MKKEWALITGASSGIGYAYAEALADRGYNLVIVSNETEALHEKAELLEQHYKVDVLPLYADLATAGAAEALYRACKQKALEIEILINNAGMFYFKPFMEERASLSEKMLYLHVLTPTQLCYYFGKEMKERRHGYMLNMSSLSAWTPYPGIALYASTKRYLRNFSRALRSELHDYGVQVAVVCPGAVATNLYNLDDKLKKLAIRLGIMMRPEQLAEKGIRTLLGGRAISIPGTLNKIVLPLLPLLPDCLIRWSLKKGKMFQ